MDFTRREAVTSMIMGAGILAFPHLLQTSLANAGEKVSNSTEKYKIKPLPFDPKKLKGFSEKLISSHHENNYGGAIKNLIKVEDQLAQTTATTPAFVVSGLRASELQFRNSMILHEMYFYNLGGDGKPSGKVEKLISQFFGSFSKWGERFRANGMGLAAKDSR